MTIRFNLTEEEQAELVGTLQEIIINDLFPLSPHIQLLTRILDKLERGAEPPAELGRGRPRQ
jgi:hypothetical protein